MKLEHIKSVLNKYKTEQELTDHMQELGYKLYKPLFLNEDTWKIEAHYTKEESNHIVKFEAIEDGYFNCLYISDVSFPLKEDSPEGSNEGEEV